VLEGSTEITTAFQQGLTSAEVFGASIEQAIINAGSLGSDETFGTGGNETTVLLDVGGLSSAEAFGLSDAVFNTTLDQFGGIASAEFFGLSSISGPTSNVVDRPRWLRVRGGSSSSSAAAYVEQSAAMEENIRRAEQKRLEHATKERDIVRDWIDGKVTLEVDLVSVNGKVPGDNRSSDSQKLNQSNAKVLGEALTKTKRRSPVSIRVTRTLKLRNLG